MTSIELIRQQIEEVRKKHKQADSYPEWCECGERWPCLTLRLAEDKLKLAEALEESLEHIQLLERVYRFTKGDVEVNTTLIDQGRRVLSEVAR